MVEAAINVGDVVSATVAKPGADASGQVIATFEDRFVLVADGRSPAFPRGTIVQVPREWVTGLVRESMGPPPATLVRTYEVRQQADARPFLDRDVEVLGPLGYSVTSQSWAQGQWGAGAFLVALLLCVVLIGVLVFIYLAIVKPDGNLTVTFTRAVASPGQAAEPAERGTLADRLAQLEEARDRGLVSDDEFAARRSALLDAL